MGSARGARRGGGHAFGRGGSQMHENTRTKEENEEIALGQRHFLFVAFDGGAPPSRGGRSGRSTGRALRGGYRGAGRPTTASKQRSISTTLLSSSSLAMFGFGTDNVSQGTFPSGGNDMAMDTASESGSGSYRGRGTRGYRGSTRGARGASRTSLPFLFFLLHFI